MGFNSLPFGELFSETQRNGLTRPKKVRGSGLPMVNMGELFAHPRIYNIAMDLVPVSEKDHQFLLAPNDLLFARQSLVLAGAGQCSIFIGNKQPTVFESHLIRCRLNAVKHNPLYYFYFFRSPAGRTAMEKIVEQGAGASGIRGSDLVNLKVPCPPKDYQDYVADVLSALDDRIALLRETNATLESLAQTLFHSWFVDYAPVRAKLEGRVPEGMDEATAALFPSSFEESELGHVPQGWRIEKLADIAKNQSSTYDFSGVKDVIFVNTGDVLEGRFLHSNFSATDKLPGQAKKAILEDDILFSEIRPKNGRFAYVNFDPKEYVVSTKFMVLRAINGMRPRYLYQILRQSSTIEFFNVIAESRSGTFPQITFDSVKSLPLVRPTDVCITKFLQITTPVFCKVDVHHKQIKQLEELRDTLLPRLIDGQVRVLDTFEMRPVA